MNEMRVYEAQLKACCDSINDGDMTEYFGDLAALIMEIYELLESGDIEAAKEELSSMQY